MGIDWDRMGVGKGKRVSLLWFFWVVYGMVWYSMEGEYLSALDVHCSYSAHVNTE